MSLVRLGLQVHSSPFDGKSRRYSKNAMAVKGKHKSLRGLVRKVGDPYLPDALLGNEIGSGPKGLHITKDPKTLSWSWGPLSRTRSSVR